MCRLLGLIANKPVDFEFSLEKFKELSTYNPDGWGIGWYENIYPHVFKQGLSAKDRKSELSTLSQAVRSKLIIAHVRKGTGAPPSVVNSHPFHYKKWLFAHNGAIDRECFCSLLKDDYKNALKGRTDSEVYFYWILQNIEDHGDLIAGVRYAVNQIKAKSHSGLNFLLSDGVSLYAFRYSSRLKDYYSLFSLERKSAESGSLEFISAETKILLRSKTLKNEKAILVCSERLTKERWREVGFGFLLIADPGLSIREVSLI